MAEALMFFARAVDGSVVDVTQVPRGSACACVCLGCNSPLLAKQGKVNAWHFGHASGAPRRDCAETALHLAGKELLHEMTAVLVPMVFCTIADKDVLGREHTRNVVQPAGPFRFSACNLEHTTGTRRLDALLESSDGRLLGIEILVTHKVDEEKAKDLASLNAPVLELDLRAWVGKPLDSQILKTVLATGAPRAVVAGAEFLMIGKVAIARDAIAGRLESIAQRVGTVLKLSPQEALECHQIAERMGVSATPWPKWLDWRGWLQRQSADDAPQRLFGAHHRVWQAACVEFVRSRAPYKWFSALDARDAVVQTLHASAYDEHAGLSEISAFLGEHLVRRGHVEYCGNFNQRVGEDCYMTSIQTARKLAASKGAREKLGELRRAAQNALF